MARRRKRSTGSSRSSDPDLTPKKEESGSKSSTPSPKKVVAKKRKRSSGSPRSSDPDWTPTKEEINNRTPSPKKIKKSNSPVAESITKRRLVAKSADSTPSPSSPGKKVKSQNERNYGYLCRYCKKRKFDRPTRLEQHEKRCQKQSILFKQIMQQLKEKQLRIPARVCFTCQQAFINASHLRRHNRTVHGDPYFEETKRLESKMYLRMNPKERRPYPCQYCGKNCHRRDRVEAHERRCRINRSKVSETHTCTVCERKFSSVSRLKRHKDTFHQNERPFLCQTCGKSFYDAAGLKTHQIRHSGVKPFSCQFCDMKFYKSNDLKKHERKHTGDKPFKCQHCPKQFARGDARTNHERTHSGTKLYKCDECEKSFSQQGYLKIHMRMHSGETPFKCKYCEASFISNARCKKHMAVHSLKKFQCPDCEQTFTRQDRLDKHILKEHAKTCSGSKNDEEEQPRRDDNYDVAVPKNEDVLGNDHVAPSADSIPEEEPEHVDELTSSESESNGSNLEALRQNGVIMECKDVDKPGISDLGTRGIFGHEIVNIANSSYDNFDVPTEVLIDYSDVDQELSGLEGDGECIACVNERKPLVESKVLQYITSIAKELKMGDKIRNDLQLTSSETNDEEEDGDENGIGDLQTMENPRNDDESSDGMLEKEMEDANEDEEASNENEEIANIQSEDINDDEGEGSENEPADANIEYEETYEDCEVTADSDGTNEDFDENIEDCEQINGECEDDNEGCDEDNECDESEDSDNEDGNESDNGDCNENEDCNNETNEECDENGDECEGDEGSDEGDRDGDEINDGDCEETGEEWEEEGDENDEDCIEANAGGQDDIDDNGGGGNGDTYNDDCDDTNRDTDEGNKQLQIDNESLDAANQDDDNEESEDPIENSKYNSSKNANSFGMVTDDIRCSQDGFFLNGDVRSEIPNEMSGPMKHYGKNEVLRSLKELCENYEELSSGDEEICHDSNIKSNDKIVELIQRETEFLEHFDNDSRLTNESTDSEVVIVKKPVRNSGEANECQIYASSGNSTNPPNLKELQMPLTKRKSGRQKKTCRYCSTSCESDQIETHEQECSYKPLVGARKRKPRKDNSEPNSEQGRSNSGQGQTNDGQGKLSPNKRGIKASVKTCRYCSMSCESGQIETHEQDCSYKPLVSARKRTLRKNNIEPNSEQGKSSSEQGQGNDRKGKSSPKKRGIKASVKTCHYCSMSCESDQIETHEQECSYKPLVGARKRTSRKDNNEPSSEQGQANNGSDKSSPNKRGIKASVKACRFCCMSCESDQIETHEQECSYKPLVGARKRTLRKDKNEPNSQQGKSNSEQDQVNDRDGKSSTNKRGIKASVKTCHYCSMSCESDQLETHEHECSYRPLVSAKKKPLRKDNNEPNSEQGISNSKQGQGNDRKGKSSPNKRGIKARMETCRYCSMSCENDQIETHEQDCSYKPLVGTRRRKSRTNNSEPNWEQVKNNSRQGRTNEGQDKSSPNKRGNKVSVKICPYCNMSCESDKLEIHKQDCSYKPLVRAKKRTLRKNNNEPNSEQGKSNFEQDKINDRDCKSSPNKRAIKAMMKTCRYCSMSCESDQIETHEQECSYRPLVGARKRKSKDNNELNLEQGQANDGGHKSSPNKRGTKASMKACRYCNMSCESDQLETHEQDCSYRPLVGARKRKSRKDNDELNTEQGKANDGDGKTSCNKRGINANLKTCRYCNMSCESDQLETHEQDCSYRPLVGARKRKSRQDNNETNLEQGQANDGDHKSSPDNRATKATMKACQYCNMSCESDQLETHEQDCSYKPLVGARKRKSRNDKGKRYSEQGRKHSVQGQTCERECTQSPDTAILSKTNYRKERTNSEKEKSSPEKSKASPGKGKTDSENGEIDSGKGETNSGQCLFNLGEGQSNSGQGPSPTRQISPNPKTRKKIKSSLSCQYCHIRVQKRHRLQIHQEKCLALKQKFEYLEKHPELVQASFQDSKSYRCHFCIKDCKSRQRFEQHWRLCQQRKRRIEQVAMGLEVAAEYSCSYCRRLFPEENVWAKHEQECLKLEKKYQEIMKSPAAKAESECKYCGQVFDRIFMWERHTQRCEMRNLRNKYGRKRKRSLTDEPTEMQASVNTPQMPTSPESNQIQRRSLQRLSMDLEFSFTPPNLDSARPSLRSDETKNSSPESGTQSNSTSSPVKHTDNKDSTPRRRRVKAQRKLRTRFRKQTSNLKQGSPRITPRSSPSKKASSPPKKSSLQLKSLQLKKKSLQQQTTSMKRQTFRCRYCSEYCYNIETLIVHERRCLFVKDYSELPSQLRDHFGVALHF